MPKIAALSALEILDSRGRPTVRAHCELASGAHAEASVPSGASTGSAEACELRDGDAARHDGLGCRRAVDNIRHEIARVVRDRAFEQPELDAELVALDGTPHKSRLGANAILAVSLAFARAVASERKLPLFRHFAAQFSRQPTTLPRPQINLFSGGKHAGGQIAIQDVLIVPLAARTMDEALAVASSVYHAALGLVREKYAMRALVADEGGLAPAFPNVDVMLGDAVEAIERAGHCPGRDVALALDIAASTFYDGSRYALGAERLDALAMVDRVSSWVDRFPIVSVEDALAENEWEHWQILTRRLRGRARSVGDDLLCTRPARIRRAVELDAADTLLLKVNQIGTLSEALDSRLLARAAGWRVIASARSGETEDDWLADLAVGWGADQIKIGSITRSERLAKYNRLLTIEAETALPLAE